MIAAKRRYCIHPIKAALMPGMRMGLLWYWYAHTQTIMSQIVIGRQLFLYLFFSEGTEKGMSTPSHIPNMPSKISNT